MRPRIRTIKPEMWQDERIVALSRDARLLLIGLVTMADDEGRFRARKSSIHGHVFPGDDDAIRRIDAWLGEIGSQGIVIFYVHGDTPYGAFRHWRRHQRVPKASVSRLPAPPDPVVLRENSVNVPVGVSELSGRSNSQGEAATIRSDPDPVVTDLCSRLAARIRRNDAKADPKPESERWRTDMRLLLQDRSGDVEEVKRIVDWCQTDAFWRSNILSPAKLRKQFTQLLLKERPSAEVVPMRRDPALEYMDRWQVADEEEGAA